MKRRAFVGGSLSGLAGCALHTELPDATLRNTNSLSERIDDAANRLLDSAIACPSIAVGVYTRAGIHTGAYGLADIATKEKANTGTCYYVASCTKAITSLALASMQEQGRLNLQTSLRSYAPDSELPAEIGLNRVSLRNLLDHTHGISNRALVHRLAYTGVHDDRTRWRLLRASTVNDEAPFGSFRYTNVGYNIATVLTDSRTQVAWQDLLSSCVFEPAGMHGSTARVSSSFRNLLAEPYRMGVDGFADPVALHKSNQTMHSAGGVIMNATDAARWMEIMVEEGRIGGRQVIPSAAVLATRVSHVATDSDGSGYSLGWHVTDHQGETAFYHTGDYPGWAAMIAYLPRRGVGVAVFSNGDSIGGRANDALVNYVLDLTLPARDAESRLAKALAGLAERRKVLISYEKQQRKEIGARAWQLHRPSGNYSGLYANSEWGDISIERRAGSLHVQYGEMRAVAKAGLVEESIGVELIPGSLAEIRFERAGAEPSSLIFSGQTFHRSQ